MFQSPSIHPMLLNEAIRKLYSFPDAKSRTPPTAVDPTTAEVALARKGYRRLDRPKVSIDSSP